MPTLENILDFYFRAMSGSHSYAGGGKPETVPNKPGWKRFVVREGVAITGTSVWILTDEYWANETGEFFGTVTITYGGGLVFYKHYGGNYKPETIPCLKAALLDAYRKQTFNGGRGGDKFGPVNGYWYENRPFRDGPRNFWGDESVMTSQKQPHSGNVIFGVGFCWYRGKTFPLD